MVNHVVGAEQAEGERLLHGKKTVGVVADPFLT